MELVPNVAARQKDRLRLQTASLLMSSSHHSGGEILAGAMLEIGQVQHYSAE